jgi:hypothetical protein
VPIGNRKVGKTDNITCADIEYPCTVANDPQHVRTWPNDIHLLCDHEFPAQIRNGASEAKSYDVSVV